mgnify:CR=1 FL=1
MRIRFWLACVMPFITVVGCAGTASQPLPALTPVRYEALSVATPLPAPIGKLRDTFRARYDEAIKVHQQQMRSSYPIVTQDLLYGDRKSVV